jgi:hypothetical protein
MKGRNERRAVETRVFGSGSAATGKGGWDLRQQIIST